MIRITAVTRTGGQVVITLEYSTDGGTIILDLDAEAILDRLKQLRALVGRKPTLAEAQEVVVALVNELRVGEEPLVDIIPWEDYIGIDLEA
jgi:hypothetical protein